MSINVYGPNGLLAVSPEQAGEIHYEKFHYNNAQESALRLAEIVDWSEDRRFNPVEGTFPCLSDVLGGRIIAAETLELRGSAQRNDNVFLHNLQTLKCDLTLNN